MSVRHRMAALLAAVVGTVWGAGALADSVITGTAYTVAGYLGGGPPIPIHYHDPDSGLVEVGAFTGSPEEVRGISEYSLADKELGPAYVSFDVYREGGLFVPRDDRDPDRNNWPFDGTINVYAYVADGQRDLEDFDAPAIGLVGSFATNGLTAGQALSFDVTDIVGNLLNDDAVSLGIRLQAQGGAPANGGAYTFTNFRLSDNRYEAVAVPLPLAAWGGMVLLGGIAFRGAFRRKP